MSCTAAIVDENGKVLIGGTGPQWEVEGPGWKAAAVGEPRYCQICQFDLDCPALSDETGFESGDKALHPRKRIKKHLVSEVVPALMRVLEKGGHLIGEKGKGKCHANGQMLIAVGANLFVIDRDFEVQGPVPYACIGPSLKAGSALGMFYATRRSRKIAEQRLKLALEASEKAPAGE